MEVQVPQDLITEILLLLPGKTLLRFRCVSKSLRHFIDSSEFINFHLAHNKTHGKIVFQHYYGRYHRINPVPVHVLNMDEPFPLDLYKAGIEPPKHPFMCSRFSNSVIAHCNGMVLLEEEHCSFVVWNPTLRKCRKLPPLPGVEYPNNQSGYSLPDIISFGFGYDSSTDDYKVLLINVRRIVAARWDNGDPIFENRYEIWILGFKSGYWRSIEPSLVQAYIDFNPFGDFRNCFVDGAFHFLCIDDVICSFDLAKETFYEVSLPDLILGKKDTDFGGEFELRNLQVLERCLCVGVFCYKSHSDLYARKKNDGGEFFWTKLFSIKYQQLSCIQSDLFFPVFDHGEILGFSKDGDKVYVLYDQYAVFSYDFKEKNIKIIVAGDKQTQNVFSCIESLVWMKEVKEMQKEESNSEISIGID